jgi:hypothetical protein
MRDEGRPLGLGRQGQGPNHRKLLRPKGRGGVSEPSSKCRNRRDAIETRLRPVAWDESGNHGAAGVDGQSLAAFEEDLKGNLYKVWNRMSAGSYFPPPVRLVETPKDDGGKRPLGIPTVADRVAQTVVKMTLEPCVEPVFHRDSYGYRPGKSALAPLRGARSSDTRMTGSFTVEAGQRPRRSWRPSGVGSRGATWSCTPPRPASCTASKPAGPGMTSPSSSTSLGTPSNLAESKRGRASPS